MKLVSKFGRHFWQKMLIITALASVNGALSTLSIIYSEYWYIFLIPLSLAATFNCIAAMMIFLSRLFSTRNNYEVRDTKRIAYIVPCYNENKEELSRTLESLQNQVAMDRHKRLLFIVCDGRVKGSGESKGTDELLSEDILKNHTTHRFTIEMAYRCWDNTYMNVEILTGRLGDLPFMCIIKDTNMGKRDSLVMIRGLCYEFGVREPGMSIEHDIFMIDFYNVFKDFCYANDVTGNIDYVIGTDADTVFSDNCSYELLKSIDREKNTQGVVGFVMVSPDCPKWNLWTIYQSTEYIVAQCLRRMQQSLITKRVSCLSGCVQILRVSKETSGREILNAFNYLPKETDNIIKQIRSYASEDRNHVCLMLHMYPYVQTRMCLSAWAYTIVPMSFSVFRSQRRRWSLGATCNDILLTYKSGINPIERVGAIVNVITYSLCSFVFVSTVVFLISIINNANIIMLYLAAILFVPLLYNLSLVFWFPFDGFAERLRYVFGYFIYITIGPIINIMVHIYSILNMDYFKWGKTRSVDAAQAVALPPSVIIVEEPPTTNTHTHT